jgi:hypothetical protein
MEAHRDSRSGGNCCNTAGITVKIPRIRLEPSAGAPVKKIRRRILLPIEKKAAPAFCKRRAYFSKETQGDMSLEKL